MHTPRPVSNAAQKSDIGRQRLVCAFAVMPSGMKLFARAYLAAGGGGMRALRLALAIVGAVVGAGFASGREVMAFFTRFGAWSWAGIAVAAATMGAVVFRLLALANRVGAGSFVALCERALGKRGGRAGTALYALMLWGTGAAMLSGAGELCAIALPVHGAYGIGFAGMLLLGVYVARRGVGALAWVSAGMAPLCFLLYALLMTRPPLPAQVSLLPAPIGLASVPMGIAYAALNIALAAGLLCEQAAQCTARERLGAAMGVAAVLGALLGLSNAAMLPSLSALSDAALPIVRLASGLRLLGFWLCVATLGLAMLSTLAAVLRAGVQVLPARGAAWMHWPLVAGLAALGGAVGFERLVGVLYPALGWAAAALVLWLCRA